MRRYVHPLYAFASAGAVTEVSVVRPPWNSGNDRGPVAPAAHQLPAGRRGRCAKLMEVYQDVIERWEFRRKGRNAPRAGAEGVSVGVKGEA